MDTDSGFYGLPPIPLGGTNFFIDSAYYSPGPPFPNISSPQYTFEVKFKFKDLSVPSTFSIQAWYLSVFNLDEFGWRIWASNTVFGTNPNQITIGGDLANFNSDRVIGNQTVVDTLWHHYALVADSGKLKIYLDGVFGGQQTITHGCNEWSEPPQILGNGVLLDDFRIWNRGLSLNELISVKDSCLEKAPNLALNFTFEDGWSEDSIQDLSIRNTPFYLTNFIITSSTPPNTNPPVNLGNPKISGRGCTGCDLGLGSMIQNLHPVICQDSSILLKDSLFSFPTTSSSFNYVTTIPDSTCDSTFNFSVGVIPKNSFNQYSVCRGGSITLPAGNQLTNMQLPTTDTSNGFIQGCPVEFISQIILYEVDTFLNEAVCKRELYVLPNGDSIFPESSYLDTLIISGPNACLENWYVNLNIAIDTVEIRESLSGFLYFSKSGDFYEWIDCISGQVLSSGQTAYNMHIPGPGSYAGILTKDGCTDTSACIVVFPNAFEKISELHFSLYPNPAKDEVKIEFPFESDYLVSIYSMEGKEVQQETFNQKESRVDISNLSRGIYSVKVHSKKNGVGLKRLVVD